MYGRWMETAGRAAGTGTGSKLKIEFSGQGAGEDGQHRQAAESGRQGAEDSRSSRPDERAGQQAGMAGEQARRGRRQEQRAARLPSFLCTNTFVAAFVLVPIMYRYRNKDELGNPCVLMHTTQ